MVEKERLLIGVEALEEGKNPGLGIKKLHKEGFTGRGINVAIIDQKLRLTHKEYKDQIVDYTEVDPIDEPVSMHGSGVSSLLCGVSCGVTPKATVHYYAYKSGRSFKSIAEALQQIVNFNSGKFLANQIRIISMSIGYKEDVDEQGLKEFKEKVEEAVKSGIFVFYVTNRFAPFIGGGSKTDKDDFKTYEPALFLKGGVKKDAIIIPTDYRTRASYLDDESYVYEQVGGMSWAVPYLSGVAALALQKNEDLNFTSFIEIVKRSSQHVNEQVKVINPVGILELV